MNLPLSLNEFSNNACLKIDEDHHYAPVIIMRLSLYPCHYYSLNSENQKKRIDIMTFYYSQHNLLSGRDPLERIQSIIYTLTDSCSSL